MKKKLKKTLQEFKEGFKIGFQKETGYGIDIVHDDNFVHNNGVLDAVFAVYAEYTDGTRKIIVDDAFMQAPKIVKKFIIYHELGHIDNTSLKYTLDSEFKADAYAASKIGNKVAIFALNYMWIYMSKNNITACADIPCRLKELGINVDSMYIQLANGTILKEQDLRLLLLEQETQEEM